MACKLAPLAVAARIAGPQHGIVARHQLLRAGLKRRAVDHLLAAGSLIPLYRGVYAVGHRPVSPRSRDMAIALLACGPVASHSAAGLWAVTRPWHGPVHALGTHSRRGPGFVIHRTRNLPPEDVTTHWGIPVTTPLRTLLDLSRHLSLDALDAALAEALVQHDLPQPTSNGFVCGYEVDLHWPELKLVAELDGYAFHAHRRAFETDRERDIVLATAGWQTVRVTDQQLGAKRGTTAERFGLLLSSRAS